MRLGGRRRRHRADQSARGPPAGRRPAVVRSLPLGHHGGPVGTGVLQRQAGRAGTALRALRGHPLFARAELQGKPRRPARSAHAGVDQPRGRLPRRLARADATWPGHRLRGTRTARGRTLSPADPHPPAPLRRPTRGSAAVRSPGGAGAGIRLRTPGRQARVRGVHAALLHQRQEGHAAQHHPAAELLGTVPQRRKRAGDDRQRRLPDRPRTARHPRRRGLPPPPAGDVRMPAHPAAALGTEGADGAHAARDLGAPQPHRRRLPCRSGKPGAVPVAVPAAARHHRRVPADEPVRPAVALSAAVEQDPVPDAARPVPRLHGGPALPDSDAQPAPLHDGRACPRISADESADIRVRRTLGALCRGPVPRHRQGARR